MISNLDKLESIVGYHFLDSRLLDRALTHRKLQCGTTMNGWSSLEIVCLGVIVSTILYRLYAESEEGELTRMRAQVVKKDTLAQIARRLQLGNYLKARRQCIVRGGERITSSILADALESLIGAVYLDAGLEQAQICVARRYSRKSLTFY